MTGLASPAAAAALRAAPALAMSRLTVVGPAGRESVGGEELLERSERVAGYMVESGLSGSRIVLALTNSVSLPVLVYAAQLAGAVPVLASARGTPAELRRWVEISGAALAIASEPSELAVGADEWVARALATPASRRAADQPRHPEAGGFTTSGSTGMPKVAAISHEGFAIMVEHRREALGDEPGDIELMVAPMCHVTFISNVHAALHAGHHIVAMKDFHAEAAVSLIESEGVTYFSGQRTHHTLIMMRGIRDRAVRLRRVYFGGAALTAAEAADLRSQYRCGLATGYGLTETSGIVTYLPDELIGELPGCVGRPLSQVAEVTTAGDAGLGGVAPDMLCVSGPQLMLGYLGSDAESSAVLRDGHLLTGDLGHVGGDGLVYITGRERDTISRGGLKVGAGEVEGVLLADPRISAAVVSGVPDPVLGARVVAAVECPSMDATREELLTLARAELADYKVPEYLEVRQQLPRANYFKLDRALIATQLAAGYRDSASG